MRKNIINKKDLYESIMNKVAKQVKKALNESVDNNLNILIFLNNLDNLNFLSNIINEKYDFDNNEISDYIDEDDFYSYAEFNVIDEEDEIINYYGNKANCHTVEGDLLINISSLIKKFHRYFINNTTANILPLIENNDVKLAVKISYNTIAESEDDYSPYDNYDKDYSDYNYNNDKEIQEIKVLYIVINNKKYNLSKNILDFLNDSTEVFGYILEGAVEAFI